MIDKNIKENHYQRLKKNKIRLLKDKYILNNDNNIERDFIIK